MGVFSPFHSSYCRSTTPTPSTPTTTTANPPPPSPTLRNEEASQHGEAAPSEESGARGERCFGENEIMKDDSHSFEFSI
jgi:hypothetical protein